jgi:hypothetical protein
VPLVSAVLVLPVSLVLSALPSSVQAHSASGAIKSARLEVCRKSYNFMLRAA